MGLHLGGWRSVTSGLGFHHLAIRALEVQVRLSGSPVALPPTLGAQTELVSHSLLSRCREVYLLFTKKFFISKVWGKVCRKRRVGRNKSYVIIERDWTLRSKGPNLNPRPGIFFFWVTWANLTYFLGNLSKSLACSESKLPPPLPNEDGNFTL